MKAIFYLIIAIPLISISLLIIYNISKLKKSRDEAINKKENYKKN